MCFVDAVTILPRNDKNYDLSTSSITGNWQLSRSLCFTGKTTAAWNILLSTSTYNFGKFVMYTDTMLMIGKLQAY